MRWYVSTLGRLLSQTRSASSLSQVRQEFQIYQYLTGHRELKLSHVEWTRAVTLKTVEDRLKYWDFLVAYNKSKTKEPSLDQEMAHERKLLEDGGCGYGHCVFNDRGFLLNSQQKQLASFTACLPKIVIDLQFLDTHSFGQVYKLLSHVKRLFEVNSNAAKLMFPVEFINTARLVRSRSEFQDGVQTCVTKQLFKPKWHPRNPYSNKQHVYYLSKHGRTNLRGPLAFNAIIVPLLLTGDSAAFRYANQVGVPTVALPFKEVFRLQQGTKLYLPIPTLRDVLEDVVLTGGDWSLSMTTHYPSHLLLSPNDRPPDPSRDAVVQERTRRIQRRMEIARLIREHCNTGAL